ncbi:MAG: hypothetical protein HQK98_09630 [Nitrospirae bacterium]|nr:hypothetical protein [Nitrospirota bacterium]
MSTQPMTPTTGQTIQDCEHLLHLTVGIATYDFKVGDTVFVNPHAPVKAGDFVFAYDFASIQRFGDDTEKHLGRVMWHYVPEKNLYPRCECCNHVLNA